MHYTEISWQAMVMGTPADMASPASAPYIPHNQSLSRLLPSARPPRGHPGASAAAGIHCPDRVGPGRRAGSPACLHDRIRSPFTCRMWRGASDPTHNHDNTGMRASVSRTKRPGIRAEGLKTVTQTPSRRPDAERSRDARCPRSEETNREPWRHR